MSSQESLREISLNTQLIREENTRRRRRGVGGNRRKMGKKELELGEGRRERGKKEKSRGQNLRRKGSREEKEQVRCPTSRQNLGCWQQQEGQETVSKGEDEACSLKAFSAMEGSWGFILQTEQSHWRAFMQVSGVRRFLFSSFLPSCSVRGS